MSSVLEHQKMRVEQETSRFWVNQINHLSQRILPTWKHVLLIRIYFLKVAEQFPLQSWWLVNVTTTVTKNKFAHNPCLPNGTPSSPCQPLQKSIKLKLIVILSLIVVQSLQIQNDKADFNTFLIACQDSAVLYYTNLVQHWKVNYQCGFFNIQIS